MADHQLPASRQQHNLAPAESSPARAGYRDTASPARDSAPESSALLFVVEPMTLSHVNEVIKIERVAFSAPWSARAYRYEIAENDHSTMMVVRPAPRSSGWLAKVLQRIGLIERGPVLGYAGFWLLVDDAHISTIAVHSRWRRMGLGELLLLSLLETGAQQGARRATLEVRASNQAAQNLYLKYGFEIVSTRKRYYADNNEDALIMATPDFSTIGFRNNLRACRARLHERLKVVHSARED